MELPPPALSRLEELALDAELPGLGVDERADVLREYLRREISSRQDATDSAALSCVNRALQRSNGERALEPGGDTSS